MVLLDKDTSNLESWVGDIVRKQVVECISFELVDEGTVIEKVTHSFAGGVCTVCNAADPDVTRPTEPSIPDEAKPTEPSAPGETEPTEPYETTPTDPAEPAPTHGDSPDYTGIVVGVVIAVAAIAALAIVLLLKRRR